MFDGHIAINLEAFFKEIPEEERVFTYQSLQLKCFPKLELENSFQ